MTERPGPSSLHRRKEKEGVPADVGDMSGKACAMKNGANDVVLEEVERQDTGYRMTFRHPIHERTDLVERR